MVQTDINFLGIFLTSTPHPPALIWPNTYSNSWLFCIFLLETFKAAEEFTLDGWMYEWMDGWVCVFVCMYEFAFEIFGLNLESLTLYTVLWNQQLSRYDKRQYNLQISLVPSTQATHFSHTDIFRQWIHEI